MERLNELALFAGAGGGILGGILCGFHTVCAVEIEPFCREVLLRRQRDGLLPVFPIWDDVRTFDGRPWRGLVDVVTGGFPCQDISVAGSGAGIDGERSGLWKDMARIIGEVGPRFVLVENSPALTSRGLGTVLSDLSEMGFDAKWGVVSAEDAIWLGGTPCVYHERERIWIVATVPDSELHRLSLGWGIEDSSPHDGSGRVAADLRPGGTEQDRQGVVREGSDASLCRWSARRGDANGHHGPQSGERQSELVGVHPGADPQSPDTNSNELEGLESRSQPSELRRPIGLHDRTGSIAGGDWWATEPDVGRVAHGVANRMDRIEAIGNGQVPAVVRLAWNLLRNS